MNELLEIRPRSKYIDYMAPDGSEIRLLKDGTRGGLCECTLGPGAVTDAVAHKRVEEVWYVISGRGKLWREFEGETSEVEISAGDSLVIPIGAAFQFAADLREPLVMLLATMPCWEEELQEGGPSRVQGNWPHRAPSAEWRIQGSWWQYGKSSDGNVRLALIRLTRTGPVKYDLAGKTWTTGWKPVAEFNSHQATFLPSSRILRYGWIRHCQEKQFAGTGEILFSPEDDIDSGVGYYDTTLGLEVTEVTRTNTAYSRVHPDEIPEELMKDHASFLKVLEKHFST